MILRIGIDFDNTLIDYGSLFHELARARGWIAEGAPATKRGIRDLLVESDGDDLRWQRLQADAYGREILRAKPYEGALEFIAQARAAGHEVVVVSHKTERSALDPSVELRTWALKWISAHGLDPSRVFFEATREEKIRRIAALGLDLFVDDMREVLDDPSFPRATTPVWFSPPRSSWKEISLLARLAAEAGPAIAAYLVTERGGSGASIAPVPGTGNNRLFRVLCADGTLAFVKKSHRGGSSEFAAVRAMRGHGIRCVPEALRLDERASSALYSYADGKPATTLAPGQREGVLAQAVDFLVALSGMSRDPRHDSLPWATDSRPRLRDYLAVPERRLERVSADPEAARFVAGELSPLFRTARERFARAASKAGLTLDEELPREERILSPSDFGLHNVIVDAGGRATFVDFEYFGWDDPAKLLADFFHHVGHNLSWAEKWRFLDAFVARAGYGPGLLARWRAVVDLIGLEWVLIVLNVFDPEVMERKRFADPGLEPSRLRAERLARAREMTAAYAARAEKPFLTIEDRPS